MKNEEWGMANSGLLAVVKAMVVVAVLLGAVGAPFGSPRSVRAEGQVSASLAIIDRKAMARDIFSEHITLRNATDRQVSLYPVVENVLVQDGTQNFVDPNSADLSSSLAHWVLLSRGVITLVPGEERAVEFEVRVNLNARPGMYHAQISFPAGSNRAEAEARLSGAPATMLNVEVLDGRTELVRLRSFAPKSRFFTGSPLEFAFELENTGDTPVLPEGDILIYDRSGREVGSVMANMSAVGVPPSVRQTFAAALQSSLGIGQYKALLSLRYGEKTTGQITDTVFFWVLPIPTVVALVVLFFGGCGALLTYLHRRYERAHRRTIPLRTAARSVPVPSATPPRPSPSPIIDLRGAGSEEWRMEREE